MAKINLGRVGFVIEGDYDASKTYKVLSIVLYEGSSYCCIKDTLIAGVLPTNEEYFVLHSLRGIQGEPGHSVELRGFEGYIQWRVYGTLDWTNLVSIADLMGNTITSESINTIKVLTQEEFDLIGQKDNKTLYIVKQ